MLTGDKKGNGSGYVGYGLGFFVWARVTDLGYWAWCFVFEIGFLFFVFGWSGSEVDCLIILTVVLLV